AVLEALAKAARDGQHHQYAPGNGTQNFRHAIAEHAARFYDLTIDPDQGVIVTNGATEGIFAAILGLVDPGDEVIVFEPCYDSYLPNITMAGAVPVGVPLRPPEWRWDPEELRAAFSSRTRALVLNTPHNPTGRVLTGDELAQIAALCQEHDVAVITDEVYEHLVYLPARHIPIATLPGMFERTVTVSSAGKLFSLTGWKIGWVTGPASLIAGVMRAHQFITFSVHHPSQEAIAAALRLPDSYYADFIAMYTRKRKLLLAALTAGGWQVSEPEGAYYIMASFADRFDGTPTEFARQLIERAGVATIPPETFYLTEHADLSGPYVRLAFCKDDALLEEAGVRLAAKSAG
ncbi:MAG TPA: aminotransferase class I/II-fold pyridoxal phosphate-dependent enzyme, partial [Ktedonobacterales bacterium]|nr:aminotransferase class I/II-fold pyridoxal phosphate-dependent enzyme [Ktedonobacterales bacterium]